MKANSVESRYMIYSVDHISSVGQAYIVITLSVTESGDPYTEQFILIPNADKVNGSKRTRYFGLLQQEWPIDLFTEESMIESQLHAAKGDLDSYLIDRRKDSGETDPYSLTQNAISESDPGLLTVLYLSEKYYAQVTNIVGRSWCKPLKEDIKRLARIFGDKSDIDSREI